MVVTGGNNRLIQRRATRKDGWTKAKRARFLDALAETCNTSHAASVVGMTPSGVRQLQRRDPAFALLCQEALDEGTLQLEADVLAFARGELAGDDNPTAQDRDPAASARPRDATLALKILQMRGAHRAGRVPGAAAPAADTDARLMKKLDAIAKKLQAGK